MPPSAYDLTPFGLENRSDVFVATTEPHGLIEATVPPVGPLMGRHPPAASIIVPERPGR